MRARGLFLSFPGTPVCFPLRQADAHCNPGCPASTLPACCSLTGGLGQHSCAGPASAAADRPFPLHLPTCSDPSLKSLMARWVSPPEVIIAGDARTCYYLHLLCALCERHAVVTLADIFAASLLLGASILIDHWPQVDGAPTFWGTLASDQYQGALSGACTPHLPMNLQLLHLFIFLCPSLAADG